MKDSADVGIHRVVPIDVAEIDHLLFEIDRIARQRLFGRVNVDSMLDMQAWFARNKFIGAQVPADRLVDARYAEYAAQRLGPFVLENKASQLAGCR